MEDLPMNDTGHFKSNQTFEYFTKFTSFDATADHQPEESEHSMDGSGPSTPTRDTAPFEYSDDIRVIKPYDIEEPDDELESSVPREDLLCLPDRFEGWQRDLTDYLDELGHQPVGSNSNAIPSMQMRGQKRKPTRNTFATQQCSPHFRRRRASAETQPKVHSFGGFREVNANESSSSEAASIDMNGDDTMHDSAMGDEMDID
ncbi:unnamed protein product [Penicillium glandicola]